VIDMCRFMEIGGETRKGDQFAGSVGHSAERSTSLFQCLLDEPEGVRPESVERCQFLARNSFELANRGVAGSKKCASCRCSGTIWQIDLVLSHEEDAISEGAPVRWDVSFSHSGRTSFEFLCRGKERGQCL